MKTEESPGFSHGKDVNIIKAVQARYQLALEEQALAELAGAPAPIPEPLEVARTYFNRLDVTDTRLAQNDYTFMSILDWVETQDIATTDYADRPRRYALRP